MPRGKPSIPTPLDRYLDVDFKVLRKAVTTGRCDIIFDTDNQAAHTRLRLWRLRVSLLYYLPNDPLGEASKSLMFQRQGNRLSIVDRKKSREYDNMLQAVAIDSVDSVSDPQEREMLARQAKADALNAEFLRLTKEAEHGNKD